MRRGLFCRRVPAHPIKDTKTTTDPAATHIYVATGISEEPMISSNSVLMNRTYSPTAKTPRPRNCNENKVEFFACMLYFLKNIFQMQIYVKNKGVDSVTQ